MSDVNTSPIKKPTLSEIFAKTDTVEYGPFKVIKPTGIEWRKAEAYYDGKPIKLTPVQNQMLALLVAYQGGAVTQDVFSDFSKNPTNSTKVQIYYIRSAIKKQTGVDVSKVIRCFNPFRGQGEKGQWKPEVKGAYIIALPQAALA